MHNWQFHSEFDPIDISGKLVNFEFELNYNIIYSYIRINISGKMEASTSAPLRTELVLKLKLGFSSLFLVRTESIISFEKAT